MTNIPSLKDLMKAGVHFGHLKSRWHPKMEPYIFTVKNGVHIINLEKTQEALKEALDFVRKTVADSGTVLFLGTKPQAQEIVKKAAVECGMPYVVYRWLGGTLTNASSVLGVIKKYRKLKADQASGALDKFTKKEQLMIKREIEKLDRDVGGLEQLNKVPEAIFIVDVKKEKTAFREAVKRNIPVISFCDTNVNPDKIDYPIPANDDAINSIKMITELMAKAVKEGQALKKTDKPENRVEKKVNNK
ncbi:MAG TPA: 30S ribosomal protein S2 [Patescibacteria group bacterium]|nr:30S ribosomal protein S2 [Patescibacteria group bacterium]